LLIGYWGYNYVRACAVTLASVHGSVEYVQPTPGGPITFHANNVQVDLPSNVIHVGGLTVRDSAGLLLASASQ